MKTAVRFVCFAFLLVGILVPTTSGQTQYLDPAGIDGAILVAGRGPVSEAALERFVLQAGGEKARIVALVVGAEPAKAGLPVLEGLNGIVKKKKGAELGVAVVHETKDLKDATGVWLVVESEKLWQDELKKHPLAVELKAVLKRGGVIGTSGPGAEMLARADGLPLFPGVVLRAAAAGEKAIDWAERLKATPASVGVQLDSEAALLLKGRTLTAVGEPKVTFHVAGNPKPRVTAAQGKIQEDLTALRRAARDRAEGFPPKNVEPPVVEKGTLVIVGGGGSPDGLYKKFVALAGGEKKANIVIFPTANADPIPRRDMLAGLFYLAGANKVTTLKGKTRAEVESKEFLDTLKEATGLWFDGGRQWRFVDCYENTKALPLMFDVLDRGGVIGGTSAGATIQGEYLARGGVFNNVDILYPGYERGLGFLKGVAIDQHFSQRKRHGDMTQLMKSYPQYLGIGIDEATAIVVKGSVADVIGKGKVHFYDAQRKVEPGQPDFEALSEGGRYDLKTRKVLPAGK